MFEEYADKFILPETGEEYLRQVQIEAKKCPAVVVAENIDPNRFVVKQTIKVTDDNGCSMAPGGFAPSDLWQRQQVADFSKLRMNLYNQQKRFVDESTYYPDENNDAAWCMFCFGTEFFNELSKRFAFFSTNNKRFLAENKKMSVPPNLSVMSTMSQPLITKLLEYHIDWFEVTGYSVQQGRWLYALLAFLDKPLTPETCSSLRSLARHCAKFRASLLESQDESLNALNLFICLVARYFDQGDMADAVTSADR